MDWKIEAGAASFDPHFHPCKNTSRDIYVYMHAEKEMLNTRLT